MRINALLSGFSPVAVSGSGNTLPISGGTAVSAGQANAAADIFVQGQPWKNLAAASRTGEAGIKSCGCKTCPACAARAYTEQAGPKEDVSAPPGAAAGKEETAAPASGAGKEVDAAAVRKGQEEAEQEGSESPGESVPTAIGPKGLYGEPLTQAERLQVAKLDLIDTKVRAHEMAHLAAAGSYATGGASFQYAKGPDGKQYAVGGEVGIDTGEASTPEATISKMQTVRAAALAPADPSPQDRKVAASASLMIAEAGHELQMIRLEQAKGEAWGKAPAESGEKGAASGNQPGKEGASGKTLPAPARNAAAIMAGLLRPASRIHIAV
ncbi:MAG: putative metalloprotease CJM1_0395 family protein [Desulfurivibrionaceae bacterium]